MEADYLARGWERTESHADADLFVIRGCSVTAHAQSECEKLIDHLKRKYPLAQFRVLGCLDVAKGAAEVRARGIGVFAEGSPRRIFRATDDNIPTRTARAYLKVQDGCNARCTFCIVPKFRGVSKSEPFAETLDKAKRFIDVGYHEIVVTGCNLAMYASEGKHLPELIASIASLDRGCRVRLGSLEPGSVATETVHVLAENANCCRFLHIPVQSGSDRILVAMRRPYKVRDVAELAHTAVKLMPDLALGCDLMTGFPDEYDNDFLATKSLFRRLPFSKAHIFPYSERPGTPAATFPGAIPPAVRSARARELATIADEARTNFIRRFQGRTVEIVIEDETTLAGWTSEYVWCQIGSHNAAVPQRRLDGTGRTVKRRDLVKVVVKEVCGHVLTGDLR